MLEHISQPCLRAKATEQQDDAADVDEAEEILCVSFPSCRQASPALEPGEQAFDLPTPLVAAQLSTVLLAPAVSLLRRDEVNATFSEETRLQRSTIPRLVGDQSRRQFVHESSVDSSLGEHTVESVSRGNIDSEWKTIAVCNCHEFRRPTGAADPDAGPPFFAGT